MSHKANEISHTATDRGFHVWSVPSELPFGWTQKHLANLCESALRSMKISQRKLNGSVLAVLFRNSTQLKGSDGDALGTAENLGKSKDGIPMYRIHIYPDVWAKSERDYNDEAEVMLTLAHELAHIAAYMDGRLSTKKYKAGVKTSFRPAEWITGKNHPRVSYYQEQIAWKRRPSEKEAEYLKFRVVNEVWGVKTRTMNTHEVCMTITLGLIG